MYDELVKRLRDAAPTALANCDFDFVEGWMLQATDATEELSERVRELEYDPTCDSEWRDCHDLGD